MNSWNLYAAAVVLAAIAVPASGEVILDIGSVFASPGSSGTIEVDVTNTSGASIVVAGFTFEISGDSDIDFTGAGFSTSAPYIFAGDSFDQANSLPLNSTTGSSLSASDISNSGNGDTLVAGQTAGLALVTFNVAPTAALGPVTISFSSDPTNTNLSDQNGNTIIIDGFVNGTIDVIPEPSGAAMLLVALAFFVGQPILAAAGFQPALFACAPVGFCSKRRSRQGASLARVNALRCSRATSKWQR
jgi:hypothetical protein